jgi:Glycosyltransferase family 87
MQAIRDMFARAAVIAAAASPHWRMLVTVLGLALCALGFGAVVLMWIEHPAYPDAGATDLLNNTDFDLYVRAADNLSSNPYRADLGTGMDRYGYPPLVADIVAGMKWLLSPEIFGPLWPVLCTAALIGALVLMCRNFGVKLGWHWIVLALGVVSIGRVIRMDLYHGQVNSFVLLLLVGGLLLRSQNRVIAAAAAFAVMMSLKPFMGIVAIYFALRGDWRTAIWSVGLGAAVFAASFIPTWPNVSDAFTGWREATHHFTSPPFITKPDNQSAYGMFLRMFTPTEYSTPWINAPGRVGPKPAVLLIECSMVFALAAFCGPLTEGNHMILAFAGLAGSAIIGAERMQAHSRNSLLWMLTVSAWSLACFFVCFPKSIWLTLGTPASWSGLDGWEILLSGRCGLLLLGAGGLTALTLWHERALLAAQGDRRNDRFERVANRAAPIRIYRVEDESVRRVRAK